MEGRGLGRQARRLRHAVAMRAGRRVTPIVIAAAALVAAAAPAWGVGGLPGLGIPDTSIGDPGAQRAGPPSVGQQLTLPFDGTPAPNTRDTGSPEDDLAQALDTLADAPDAATAADARTLAISILEGDPLPRKIYSGLPLLNWNAPAKVKTVPAGGNVTVDEVRFGDHILTDTWLLDFADPNAPFTITYHVTEVGVGFGGVFAPTLLLADAGHALGGQPSIVQTLALPELPAGTSTKNKFHPVGGHLRARDAGAHRCRTGRPRLQRRRTDGRAEARSDRAPRRRRPGEGALDAPARPRSGVARLPRRRPPARLGRRTSGWRDAVAVRAGRSDNAGCRRRGRAAERRGVPLAPPAAARPRQAADDLGH